MFRTVIACAFVMMMTSIGCDNGGHPADQNSTAEVTSEAPSGLDSDTTTYTDPFVYCEARQKLDEPGSDYTGTAVPEAIAASMQQQLGESGQPLDNWEPEQIQWRCMTGKVYACIPRNDMDCAVKLNFSRVGSSEMKDFCRTNPNRPNIPETVVAQESPYQWLCDGDKPMVKSQQAEADQAGFNAAMWLLIEPPPQETLEQAEA